MNQYEAMFLFDPTFGNSYENCEAEIRRLMERAEAEILACGRWDERRLAYRVKGRKRGVYVLVYFKAQPAKLVPLERDAQLSDNILRLLVLRADGIKREVMEQAVAGHQQRPEGDETARDAEAKPKAADDEAAEPMAEAVEKDVVAAVSGATEDKEETVSADQPRADAVDDEMKNEAEPTVTE